MTLLSLPRLPIEKICGHLINVNLYFNKKCWTNEGVRDVLNLRLACKYLNYVICDSFLVFGLTLRAEWFNDSVNIGQFMNRASAKGKG